MNTVVGKVRVLVIIWHLEKVQYEIQPFRAHTNMSMKIKYEQASEMKVNFRF